ncbi:MAG: hypothetical protein AAF637_22750, partial [Pseudomonadota bacterium]
MRTANASLNLRTSGQPCRRAKATTTCSPLPPVVLRNGSSPSLQQYVFFHSGELIQEHQWYEIYLSNT